MDWNWVRGFATALFIGALLLASCAPSGGGNGVDPLRPIPIDPNGTATPTPFQPALGPPCSQSRNLMEDAISISISPCLHLGYLYIFMYIYIYLYTYTFAAATMMHRRISVESYVAQNAQICHMLM